MRWDGMGLSEIDRRLSARVLLKVKKNRARTDVLPLIREVASFVDLSTGPELAQWA